MLTAQSFAALDEVEARRISVIALSPGLTGGTSLGRDSSRARRVCVTVLMRTVFRLVGLFRPNTSWAHPSARAKRWPRSPSVPSSHRQAGSTSPWSRDNRQPTYPDPSEPARSRDAQDRLWRESAAMVGIDQQTTTATGRRPRGTPLVSCSSRS
ncbi:hypothetical protein [Streptomyces sp. UG1]|uniref:hypothetical protein n=1 Tax=Streptomyces sp. UG1 TaxID=3417652 RepID=UPI003CE79B3C